MKLFTEVRELRHPRAKTEREILQPLIIPSEQPIPHMLKVQADRRANIRDFIRSQARSKRRRLALRVRRNRREGVRENAISFPAIPELQVVPGRVPSRPDILLATRGRV